MPHKTKKKILGIILARSGSKRIPGKNIKNFCGKPLLAWSVIVGKESCVLDRLILNTDSEEYAVVGKKFGAEIPFLRPMRLAKDASSSLAVLRHTVEWLQKKENYYPDYVVLLEPTAPCRRFFHIKESVELALKTNADSVVSMSPVPTHFNFHWQFSLNKKKKATLVGGVSVSKIIKRGQDLPITYYRNGVIYVFKTELLFEQNPGIYGKEVRAYLTDERYSHDIDDLNDWKKAEQSFYKILKEEKIDNIFPMM